MNQAFLKILFDWPEILCYIAVQIFLHRLQINCSLKTRNWIIETSQSFNILAVWNTIIICNKLKLYDLKCIPSRNWPVKNCHFGNFDARKDISSELFSSRMVTHYKARCCISATRLCRNQEILPKVFWDHLIEK